MRGLMPFWRLSLCQVETYPSRRSAADSWLRRPFRLRLRPLEDLGVDAGIKRQQFRRFCSQRKPAIGQDAVPTLYEILNFSPWRSAGDGATIGLAPNSPILTDGLPVIRRAPHADLDTQVVYRHSPLSPQFIAARCDLAMQWAWSINADRRFLIAAVVRLETKRCRVFHSSHSCRRRGGCGSALTTRFL
jgi:hypothetical protein